jgi:ATP-binding cassette subfamily C protein CydD/ATP-binding cassette subfamily C protein CydCD
VSFRYEGTDTDALTEVDFTWEDDPIVALSGANGSGKSTCLRVLLALGTPRAGSVRLGSVSLAEIDADGWRRHVGFMPQHPYFPARAGVRAAVRLLAPQASDARITSALERVGLLATLQRAAPDPLAVRVDTLSVGQRQRVALARMLCRDASIFVLDEPDANLDRAGVALVADIIRSLSKDHKILIAAHTPELIAVADRVIEFDRGRIVRDERKGHG